MSQMGRGITFIEKRIFGIQRKMVAYMTQKSWNEIPHVSYVYEPDMTDFFQYFQDNKERFSKNGKISFNTLMLKVIAEGLKAAPELNANLEYSASTARGTHKIAKEINIALPWMLDNGDMFTPIVKDVGSKNLHEITDYINDIARRLKNTILEELLYKVSFGEKISDLKSLKFSSLKQIIPNLIGKHRVRRISRQRRKEYYKIPEKDRLTPADIFGATTLVSNIGSINRHQKGAVTVLEIIAPQVFVIGLNALQDRPGVYTDANGKQQIGIRKILPICCTFDHRAVDFGQLLPFQDRIAEIIANPKEIDKWV